MDKAWKEYALIAVIALIVVYLYHSGMLNFLFPGRKTVKNGTPLGDEYAPGTSPSVK